MNDNTNKFLFANDVREYLLHNTSYIPTATVDPKLFSCYDDYYCNSDALAGTGHVLLGVFGLILSLFALALNVLLIPVLSLVGIRSSATYYMIGMAIADCCLLVVNVLLVVIRYLPSGNQVDQLLIYQSFVAYLVPFGLPLKTVCQALSTTLCACLVLDRFVYYRTEAKLDTAKRAIAVKVMITAVVFTILFKLPNFLVYKIVENSSSVLMVKWTLLAKSWIFIIDTTMFTVVYLVLVVFTCILWHVIVTCQFLPKVVFVKMYEVHLTERFQRRERLYIMIGLLVAMLTVILKFSEFLRHFFFGFSTNTHDLVQMQRLGITDMWMESLDLMLIIAKPCIYIVFAVHFRQALKDMIGLLVKPSRYTLVKASGGMGKLIDLRVSNSEMNRSDTSNSLLNSHNSEYISSRSSGKFPIDIAALAAKQVFDSGKINKHSESNTSSMSAGSSNSVTYNSKSGSKEDPIKF